MCLAPRVGCAEPLPTVKVWVAVREPAEWDLPVVVGGPHGGGIAEIEVSTVLLLRARRGIGFGWTTSAATAAAAFATATSTIASKTSASATAATAVTIAATEGTSAPTASAAKITAVAATTGTWGTASATGAGGDLREAVTCLRCPRRLRCVGPGVWSGSGLDSGPGRDLLRATSRLHIPCFASFVASAAGRTLRSRSLISPGSSSDLFACFGLSGWSRIVDLFIRSRNHLIAFLHHAIAAGLLCTGTRVPALAGKIASFGAGTSIGRGRDDVLWLSRVGRSAARLLAWSFELGEAGVDEGRVGAGREGRSLRGIAGGIGFSDIVGPLLFGLEGGVVDRGLLDLGICRVGLVELGGMVEREGVTYT